MGKKKAKHAGGRPLKLTDDVRAEVIVLISEGVSQEKAAEIVGVVPTAIREHAKKHPEFLRDLARAHAKFYRKHLSKIDDSEDWKASQWLLKVKWPDEFADAILKQLSVSLTAEEIARMSDEELNAFVRRLIALAAGKGTPET